MPDKYTVCGLLFASSLSVILAVLVLASLGVKVAYRIQLAPEAKLGIERQLFGPVVTSVKSPAFVPIS